MKDQSWGCFCCPYTRLRPNVSLMPCWQTPACSTGNPVLREPCPPPQAQGVFNAMLVDSRLFYREPCPPPSGLRKKIGRGGGETGHSLGNHIENKINFLKQYSKKTSGGSHRWSRACIHIKELVPGMCSHQGVGPRHVFTSRSWHWAPLNLCTALPPSLLCLDTCGMAKVVPFPTFDGSFNPCFL